mgnify:CR=1 FL=1
MSVKLDLGSDEHRQRAMAVNGVIPGSVMLDGRRAWRHRTRRSVMPFDFAAW